MRHFGNEVLGKTPEQLLFHLKLPMVALDHVRKQERGKGECFVIGNAGGSLEEL
jgi:hypothetical protein